MATRDPLLQKFLRHAWASLHGTLAFALVMLPLALSAQPNAPRIPAAEDAEPTAPQPEDIRAAVTQLADLLAKYYVIPDTGQRYADSLRAGLAAGEFTHLDSPAEIATRLSERLQATASDGHLRVIAPGAITPQRMVMGGATTVVEAAGWVADGIAYLRLGVLPGSPDGVAAIEAFLHDHADAATLIIDSRGTPGGSGDTADLMMSYFFDAPRPLLRMEMRSESHDEGWAPLVEGPSVKRMEAPSGNVAWERSIIPHPTEHRLKDVRLFLLTSRRTGSAAEAMALALKRTGRAVLIGENTYGAGYFTRPLEIGAGFTVNLPIGRTYDPDTGRGFEGSGVAPHVHVPAGGALEEALRRAGITEPSAIAAAVAKAGAVQP